MQCGEILFRKYEIRGSFETLHNQISGEINNIEENRLLNTSTEDLAKYYAEKFQLDFPVLHEVCMQAENVEVDIDISKDQSRYIRDRSRPFMVKGTAISVEIPFSGDKNFFFMSGSRWDSCPPRAEVKNEKIILRFEFVDVDGLQLKTRIDRELENIKQYLAWLEPDVERFNSEIAGIATAHIERRKKKILSDKALVASLGFSLKQREGASLTYITPEVKRKVVPIFPNASAAPYQPEPALSEEDYAYILSIMENMSQVMERSPNDFTTMKEETLRSHFLVQLNGHYQGQATGETFNRQGKTDIYVRVDGKNIFIAECKFWTGKKKYLETIDQILGYLSWRDTKAAIVIFNRNKDFSAILGEIESQTEQHPNCKKLIRKRSETSWSYRFAHRDDPNREIAITVLAFTIPQAS